MYARMKKHEIASKNDNFATVKTIGQIQLQEKPSFCLVQMNPTEIKWFQFVGTKLFLFSYEHRGKSDGFRRMESD